MELSFSDLKAFKQPLKFGKFSHQGNHVRQIFGFNLSDKHSNQQKTVPEFYQARSLKYIELTLRLLSGRSDFLRRYVLLFFQCVDQGDCISFELICIRGDAYEFLQVIYTFLK